MGGGGGTNRRTLGREEVCLWRYFNAGSQATLAQELIQIPMNILCWKIDLDLGAYLAELHSLTTSCFN